MTNDKETSLEFELSPAHPSIHTSSYEDICTEFSRITWLANEHEVPGPLTKSLIALLEDRSKIHIILLGAALTVIDDIVGEYLDGAYFPVTKDFFQGTVDHPIIEICLHHQSLVEIVHKLVYANWYFLLGDELVAKQKMIAYFNKFNDSLAGIEPYGLMVISIGLEGILLMTVFHMVNDLKLLYTEIQETSQDDRLNDVLDYIFITNRQITRDELAHISLGIRLLRDMGTPERALAYLGIVLRFVRDFLSLVVKEDNLEYYSKIAVDLHLMIVDSLAGKPLNSFASLQPLQAIFPKFEDFFNSSVSSYLNSSKKCKTGKRTFVGLSKRLNSKDTTM